jgi:hypothetical protein
MGSSWDGKKYIQDLYRKGHISILEWFPSYQLLGPNNWRNGPLEWRKMFSLEYLLGIKENQGFILMSEM